MGPQPPAPEPGISWPALGGPPPAPTGRGRKPQSTAVVVLSLALAGLITLWVVGGSLLWHYAPQMDVPLNGSSPTATPTR
jgi:hypothetical protein